MRVDQTSYHTLRKHISSGARVFAQRAENAQGMAGDDLGEVRPSCIVATCILVDSGEGDGLIAVSGLPQDMEIGWWSLINRSEIGKSFIYMHREVLWTGLVPNRQSKSLISKTQVSFNNFFVTMCLCQGLGPPWAHTSDA